MMKYEAAEMDIVKFEAEDVITTSGNLRPDETPIG
jgi:hypothetical protein